MPTKNDDWDSSRDLLAGAVEAVYERSGSGADPGLGIAGREQCARRGQRLGGSGGMLPQEIFEVGTLRSILVHFGTIFHNGQARVQTESVALRRTIMIELRPNLDRIIPATPLQNCKRPDETSVYCAEAVRTRELPRAKVMNLIT